MRAGREQEKAVGTKRLHVCMIVPEQAVKGGIAAVVNGYRGSALESRFRVTYIESYRDGSKWQKLGKALRGYFTFFRLLRKDRPDLLHVHASFGPSFYRKIPFLLGGAAAGVPVVNHIHGAEFEAFYDQALPAKRWLIRRVYGKCAKIIALSEEWRARLCQIVPQEKIVILENYCRIPEEPFDQGRRGRQILFLGELGRRKGCYEMPEILSRVRESCPDAHLALAGDGEMAQLREAFVRRGLSEAVSFPGWVRGSEKEALLRESGVFLFPSHNEGMPMSVLEAMAYGLGIVATRVGGIPRLIQDGESGYLAESGDVEAMAEAVTRLLSDPIHCRALGLAARARAASSYSLERHLEGLGEIYLQAARTAACLEARGRKSLRCARKGKRQTKFSPQALWNGLCGKFRGRRFDRGKSMGLLGRAARSAAKILYWKCRFGAGLQAPLVEGFDHVHLELAQGGRVILGERIQNRGHLYLQCGERGRLRLGSHVFFNTGASVACMGRVQIGDCCKIGNNTVIVDHDHNFKGGEDEYLTGEVILGRRVWVGANCTILKGANIGDDCVIGAGSVVRGKVPAGTTFIQKRESRIRERGAL